MFAETDSGDSLTTTPVAAGAVPTAGHDDPALGHAVPALGHAAHDPAAGIDVELAVGLDEGAGDAGGRPPRQGRSRNQSPGIRENPGRRRQVPAVALDSDDSDDSEDSDDSDDSDDDSGTFKILLYYRYLLSKTLPI